MSDGDVISAKIGYIDASLKTEDNDVLDQDVVFAANKQALQDQQKRTAGLEKQIEECKASSMNDKNINNHIGALHNGHILFVFFHSSIHVSQYVWPQSITSGVVMQSKHIGH